MIGIPAVHVWLPDDPPPTALAGLPDGVDVHLIPSSGELPGKFAEVEFLVPPFESREVLATLPRLRKLRVVQAMSSGVDWIEEAIPPGVTLCNARGTRDTPVAEWVLAVVLDSYRELSHFRRRQEEGCWHPHIPHELAGSTALIVGYGSIGSAVEVRLRPFGVEVLKVATTKRDDIHGADSIDCLVPRADIVIVLLPATSETIGAFDRKRLARMQDGALLVNAGRGPVVDSEALRDELESGRIRAAIDVTDPEPLPATSPLWDLPNLLITPHIAGDSPDADRRAHELVADQIRRHHEGRPLLNVVRPPGTATPTDAERDQESS